MNHSSRKRKFIVAFSTVFSLALVFVVAFWGVRGNESVYSSEKTGGFLEATFEKRDEQTLADWEKDILDRKSNVASVRSSITGDIGIATISEYLKAKNANIALSEEAMVQQVIKNVIEMNPLEEIQKEIEFKKYSVSDLKVSVQNDTEKLKEYGNNFGLVSQKNSYNSANGNEFEILMLALNQEKPEMLNELGPIITAYENAVVDLLKIDIPSSVASIHLEMLNSLGGTIATLKEMKFTFNDPLRSIFVFDQYIKYGLTFFERLKEIDNLMKTNNVHFSEEDPGSSIEILAALNLDAQP